MNPAQRIQGTVLIADDEPAARLLASEILTEAGFDVRQADDGAQALEEIYREQPAAVVLDLAMPKLDGYEVIEKIRAQPASRELPILVMTAHATRAEAAAALARGADDFLPKGYEIDELPARVRALINRRTSSKGEGHASLRVRLFGPLEVRIDERFAIDEHFTRRKAKALFAFLFLNRGLHISRDELMDALWPEVGFGTSGRLKQTVSVLRSAIEPCCGQRQRGDCRWRYILEKAGRYYFNNDAEYSSDVEDFERELALSQQCQRHGDTDQALAHYTQAFELRQAEFLPEFRYEDWAAHHSARLAELYLQALEDAARLHGANHHYGQAVQLLRQSLRQDPLRESTYLELMRFLWMDHRHGDALRVYQRLREKLARELEIEPEPEATRLWEAVRRDRTNLATLRRETLRREVARGDDTSERLGAAT